MSSFKTPLDVSEWQNTGDEPCIDRSQIKFGEAPFLLKTSNNARAKAETKFVRGPKALWKSPERAIAGFRPDLLPGTWFPTARHLCTKP